jgi:hypothetical protein
MINMNSLKRVIPFAGAFLLAGAMVGCGDDDNTVDPIDAGPDAAQVPDGGGGIDACVGGHGGGCIDSPFQLPEHGEFRLEQFQYAPSGTGVDDDLAAQAFFFSGQTPAARSLEGKVITIRQALVDQGYVCQDFSDGNNFDNGYTPEAQAVANSRTYVDVGANATLTNVDNGADVITLDKYLSADDPMLATDLSASLVHDILYRGSKDTAVNLGGQYEPKIAGVLAYPGLELGYGQSAAGDEMADEETGEGEPKIFMPSDFQMTTPTEADFFAPAGLTFTKGEDLLLEYDIEQPETIGPNDYPTIIVFIGFVAAGGVDAYCLKVTPGELDDGTFTVPSEVLEIIPEDPAADDALSYILFGRFTHVAWEAENLPEPARLDLLGVTCLIAQDWVVNDAAQ